MDNKPIFGDLDRDEMGSLLLAAYSALHSLSEGGQVAGNDKAQQAMEQIADVVGVAPADLPEFFRYADSILFPLSADSLWVVCSGCESVYGLVRHAISKSPAYCMYCKSPIRSLRWQEIPYLMGVSGLKGDDSEAGGGSDEPSTIADAASNPRAGRLSRGNSQGSRVTAPREEYVDVGENSEDYENDSDDESDDSGPLPEAPEYPDDDQQNEESEADIGSIYPPLRRVRSDTAEVRADRSRSSKDESFPVGPTAKMSYADVVFASPDIWADIIDTIGADHAPSRTENGWTWSCPGLTVTASVNPFTGTSLRPPTAGDAPGYNGERDEGTLGAVEVSGSFALVQRLCSLIERLSDVKR